MDNHCHCHNHDLEKTIQTQLVTFSRILRSLGVRVGTSEIMDALRALSFTDITKRDQFKTTLKALLVKSKHDGKLFDMAFERFFVPPEEKEAWRREEQRRQEEQTMAQDQAVKELSESIRESGGRWAGGAQEQLELTPEQKEVVSNMPAKERRRLQHIIESFEGNPVNDPSGLIADVVEASLNYWRYYMLKQEEKGIGGRGRSLNVKYTGQQEIDDILRSVAQEYSTGQEDLLLYQDMQSIADEDLPRVTALVNRLSRNLANRISRRYKRSSSKKQPDIRRTVRNNLAYGGVPLKLAYRSKRITRPRLVVVCDVSVSMVRYARFIIQFVYGLAHVVRDIETFIFSEDLERITPYFKGGGGFADTMSKIMTESVQWGKTTNLNSALFSLEDEYRYVLTPDTYFIIVSDTKTQQSEQAARRVSDLRRKVKDIIWLNPLPEEDWERTFTVQLFEKHSRMFECGTVFQLEQALRKQLI